MFFLSWWMTILVAVFAYFILGLQVSKYRYWKKYGLRFKEPNLKDLLVTTCVWPLACALEPHNYAKALILPSMWLDKEFRELYPVVKKQNALDKEREREVVTNKYVRERTEARAHATLVDHQHDYAHQRNMEMIKQEDDGVMEQLLNDIPPAIEAGQKYDPNPEPVVEIAEESQFHCGYHRVWHSFESKTYNANQCYVK